MRIITLAIFAAVLVTARAAAAQPVEGNTSATLVGATHGTGVGVGAAAMQGGLPFGLSVAYDAGPWHIDSILGIAKGDGESPFNRTSFGLGGRFWWHLHKTANADFSIGGGLGFSHNGPTKDDILTIEAGGQLRAFIASNVSLSFSTGLAIQ